MHVGPDGSERTKRSSRREVDAGEKKKGEGSKTVLAGSLERAGALLMC